MNQATRAYRNTIHEWKLPTFVSLAKATICPLWLAHAAWMDMLIVGGFGQVMNCESPLYPRAPEMSGVADGAKKPKADIELGHEPIDYDMFILWDFCTLFSL